MDSGRIPEFKSVEILQGGGVESGTYYLGVAYADKDFTETNVLTLSNPVYVVPSPEDTIPREIISGSPNEFQTNKSLKWTINRVNTDYKYAVPYVLQRIGNAEFVYKLEPVEINTSAVGNLLPNEVEITYSGLENAAQSSIEEAVVDKVKFLTAKSLTQLDNKLYAANLTARKDLGFQRFANGIQLQAITKDIVEFDPRSYDLYNINYGYASVSQDLNYPFPVDYNFADTKWKYYCTQARNQANFPSIDKYESFMNQWVRLIPNLNRHANFFENLGTREELNRGAYGRGYF